MIKGERNSKIKKAVALTLAGIAAIGAGSIAASNMKDAKALRILGGLKNIITGRNTSNGTAYQGMHKSSSTITNSAFNKNLKTSSSSAKVNTSRVLNGSKGSINSGATTSNGTAYQGMKGNQTSIDNSAFDTGVKKHSAVTKQIKTVEKHVSRVLKPSTGSTAKSTSDKSTQTTLTKNASTQTSHTTTSVQDGIYKAEKVKVDPEVHQSSGSVTANGKITTSLKLNIKDGKITNN